MIQDLEHGYHTGCPFPKPEITTTTSTTTTSTTTTTTSSEPSTTQTAFIAPIVNRSKVTVNSPNAAQSFPFDALQPPSLEETCPTCNCECSELTSVPSGGDHSTSTESSGSLFPTIV